MVRVGLRDWVRVQQCTGINLITIREHNHICLYCIVLIKDKLSIFLKMCFLLYL